MQVNPNFYIKPDLAAEKVPVVSSRPNLVHLVQKCLFRFQTSVCSLKGRFWTYCKYMAGKIGNIAAIAKDFFKKQTCSKEPQRLTEEPLRTETPKIEPLEPTLLSDAKNQDLILPKEASSIITEQKKEQPLLQNEEVILEETTAKEEEITTLLDEIENNQDSYRAFYQELYGSLAKAFHSVSGMLAYNLYTNCSYSATSYVNMGNSTKRQAETLETKTSSQNDDLKKDDTVLKPDPTAAATSKEEALPKSRESSSSEKTVEAEATCQNSDSTLLHQYQNIMTRIQETFGVEKKSTAMVFIQKFLPPIEQIDSIIIDSKSSCIIRSKTPLIGEIKDVAEDGWKKIIGTEFKLDQTIAFDLNPKTHALENIQGLSGNQSPATGTIKNLTVDLTKQALLLKGTAKLGTGFVSVAMPLNISWKFATLMSTFNNLTWKAAPSKPQ